MKKLLITAILLVLGLICFVSCSCNKETVQNDQTVQNQTPPKQVTVSFETYLDGVKIPPQTVNVGARIAAPTQEMVRAGYSLIGWFNGDKMWDFNKNVATENITLIAKWESYLSYAAISEITDKNILSIVGESNKDGIIVTGCNFNVENVIIPKTYNGKKVVGIHWGFANRTKIKSIVIPDTVVYISTNAFNRCENLKSIVIPKSVTYLDRGAFFLCTSLEAIYCEAPSKPVKWHKDFNLKTSKTENGEQRYNVVYNYQEN